MLDLHASQIGVQLFMKKKQCSVYPFGEKSIKKCIANYFGQDIVHGNVHETMTDAAKMRCTVKSNCPNLVNQPRER
jgi:hypothetical protein